MRRALLASIVLATFAGTINVASGAEPSRRPNGSGWRTVVIPVAAPRFDPAWTARITTGSLPPAASPPMARPLVGVAHMLEGIASFYWQDQMTASGERFDRMQMTAAHRTLPMGTRVRVTHLASGRSVVVRINDRGPFKPGRVIDLSQAAAERLGMAGAGLARVRIEMVN